MVRLTFVAFAATCASVAMSGPIVVAPSADVSMAINPQHTPTVGHILPPTKRRTAAKEKRSSLPEGANTDPFSGSRRQYIIRVTNPADGSEMGIISTPGAGSDGNDGDDLISFDRDGKRARQFAFGPGAQEGNTFEMSPAEDEGVFGRRGGMLAAVGRGRPADLGQGSPNFANLGLARELPGGLLNLIFPLDMDLPSRLLSLGSGSPFTKGIAEDGSAPGGLSLGILDGPLEMLGGGGDGGNDDAMLGPIKKLLANPQSINESGAPQSSIWTMDPVTRRLNARYRNSNGDVVPTQFVTGGACEHFICLTADMNMFRQVWGDDTTELHLTAGVL